MAIQRSGPTPSFYEYICGFVLIPQATTPSPQLMSLVGPGQQLNWVDIPSFQRGISWDLENVNELLQSDSILLGNAILSQFNVNNGQFPKLLPSPKVYLVLVDGLQRLAVGTALLSVLHDLVLSNRPGRPGDAVHFAALSARVTPLSAFYLNSVPDVGTMRVRKIVGDLITRI